MKNFFLMLLLLPVFVLPGQVFAGNLEQMIGQMIMVGFRGYMVDEQSPVARDILEHGIGGVILFDYDVEKKAFERNIKSPQQLKELIASLQELSGENTLLVAVDQEGGRVSRLKKNYGFRDSVSQAYLGELNDLEVTLDYALNTAQDLAELGINLNLAPVVDLNTNQDNPVIGRLDRSFSHDPLTVTLHAREVVGAHRVFNVLTALKHFPGHGSSEEDSHLGFVDVSATWDEKELVPFKQLIADHDCDMVMTAHIYNRSLDPDWPATMSAKTVNGILRKRLGFEGVVISDDMQMKAIKEHYPLELALEKTILAGVDMIIFANNMVYEEDIASRSIAIIRDLVKQGRVSEERIRQSYQRINELKSGLRPLEQSSCSFCLK